MSVQPLPVPHATLPLWRRAALPQRLPTAWPALGWGLLFWLSIPFVDEGGCSAAAPCGPAPALELVEGLTVVAPFLLWLLPWHARAGALVLAASWTTLLLVDAAGLPVPELLGLTAALTVWTLLVDAALRARREEAAELAAAAPQAPWPGPVPDGAGAPGPLAGRRLAGALLLGAAALAAVDLVQVAQARAEEAGAARTSAQVAAHGDDGYLVTLRVGGRTVQVDTYLADQYPVGSTQPVLLVGDEVRLVAEPAAPWVALALAEVLAAAAVVVGVRRRRRVRLLHELYTEPQPVLSMQARPYGGGALLLADDARPLDGPALALADVALWEDREDHLERPSEEELAQQRVTAYGLPLPGHPVGLATSDGRWLVPVGLCRPAPDLATLPFKHLLLDRPVEPGVPDPRGLEALAAPPWLVRLGQVVALAGLPALVWVGATAGTPGELVLRTLLVLNLAVGGLLQATSRVRVEDDALVVLGPLSRRRLPWSALRSADVVGQGLVVLTDDERALALPVRSPLLPRVPGLRRQARRDRLRAGASVLQARIAAAARDGRREERERAPWAGAYAVAVALSVLAGAVLR